MRIFRSWTRAYGAAVGTTLLALLATFWTGSEADRTAFVLFLGAIIVSAYFGGVRAGVLATAVATGILLYQFHLLSPQSPARPGHDTFLSLALFGFVGCLASYLSWECLRAIKESTRSREAFAGIPDGVVVMDRQGHVLFLNAAARALTGWPEGAAGPATLDNLLHAVDADSPVPLAQFLRAGKGSRPTGTALLRSRDGTERPVQYWASSRPDAAGKLGEIVLVFRDISTRRREEQELQQHAEQFRALAACAPVAILLLDVNGHCTFSNAAWQASVGASAEDCIGDGWARFLHPEDRAAAAAWSAAAREGKSYTRELRLQDAHGKPRWVRLCAEAVRTQKGQCLGHVGSIEDLTERELRKQQRLEHDAHVRQADQRLAALEQARGRLEGQLAEHGRTAEEQQYTRAQAEAAWRQAEARLRAEAADLARANQLAQEQLAQGRRVEEQLRQEIHGLAQGRQQAQAQVAELQHTMDSQRATLDQRQAQGRQAEEALRQEIAGLGQRLQQAEAWRAEHQRAADGQRQALEQRQGEWRQLEEQLRRELAGMVQAHQQAQAQAAEHQQNADVYHQTLAQRQAEWQAVEKQLRQDIAGLAQAHQQARAQVADGEQREQRLRQEHTELHAQHGMERQRLEQQLRTLEEAVRRAGVGADRWTGRVQPALVRLRAAADAVQRDLKHAGRPPEAGAVLDLEIQRLTMMVDGLGILSRLAHGALTLQPEPVELNALIDGVVRRTAPWLHTRAQHLTVSLPLQPIWFHADAAHLEQVLLHLLDNAARYSEAGGDLELTADRNDGDILVRVKDRGVGIPAADLAGLLGSGTGGGDAPGIGLPLVRGLVELHGGTVSLASPGRGQGTEVVIHLPETVRVARAPRLLALPRPPLGEEGTGDDLKQAS